MPSITMIIFRKYNLPIRKAWVWAKSLQSCPTLCDPMDCSLPGSYVRGILQGRILEWTAMHSCLENPMDRGAWRATVTEN